ncbi:hypothetical protein P7K49_017311 [Saguinus oedipus]|uniref:Uncharacterized protein n=1 Tax=Saguinus oedipus TaxID=9490 RepID=A0ABQ9V364_SAGOE|nr:hypothetical protein P7K49_017311 [Saguinus oedipus]
MAPIPSEALRGMDGDSGPEDLIYTIEQPSSGWVVLRAAPGTEVHSFSRPSWTVGSCCSHTEVGAEGLALGSCCPWGSPEVGSQLGPVDPMPPSPGALNRGFRFGLSDSEHASSRHF